MTALRRIVQIRGMPMRPLDLNVMCEQCNNSRAHGNRTKCSRRIILNKPTDQHQVRSIIDGEELRKLIVSNRSF